MTESYRVGITKREGTVDGWVFDLPGCRAIGGSVDEVVQLLPVVIAEHIVWLNAHGDVMHDASTFDFKVVEEVSQAPDVAEFCFEADKEPLTADDIEQAVRVVSYAYDDIVSLTGALPDAILHWKPPASAVKIEIFPDVRSIREMVAHVASGLTFHLRGVGDLTTRIPSPEGDPGLSSAFETTLARLRSLNDEERAGKVFWHESPRGSSEWTARKSLRRLPNHQRFHTREIQQRLCWLILGVPEVLPVSRE